MRENLNKKLRIPRKLKKELIKCDGGLSYKKRFYMIFDEKSRSFKKIDSVPMRSALIYGYRQVYKQFYKYKK